MNVTPLTRPLVTSLVRLLVQPEDGNVAGPVNTVAPVISNAGTGELGDILSTTDGTWTSEGTISGYTYQWRRGEVPISGANAYTYTLVEADDDLAITCRVTATDEFGSRARNSNSLGPYDLVEEVGLPAGALTYGGEPLTYGGEYLTYNS